MDPEISIIIPCLNEEQNIPILVMKLEDLIRQYQLSAEILIVDDCSDDYTFREALMLEHRHPMVRALHKGLPRGIGAAIKYGIAHARGAMGTIVMGDCVDPLAAIPDFRQKTIEEGFDLVLLSRYLAPEDSTNIPASYRFYHFWYRLLSRWVAGVDVKDISYAFRGFRMDWIRSLKLESDGFEISPETTFKAWFTGSRICELRGRQGRRMAGESKFLFSKEGAGYARVLIKAIWMRVASHWMGSDIRICGKARRQGVVR